MAKPNKPGEWYSRDGRRIVVFRCYSGRLGFYAGDTSIWDYIDHLHGDDWLPAIAPKFPELPPKPPQVLLRAHGRVRWYAVEGDRLRWMKGFDYLNTLPDDLKIIPHPDNDPEAVRLIEEAKREEDQF